MRWRTSVVKNEAGRARSVSPTRCEREYYTSILQPRDTMIFSVETLDYRRQHFLTRERLQLHHHCPRRPINHPRTIDKGPPYRPQVAPLPVSAQLRCHIRHRVVDQRHQPTHQLECSTLEPRTLGIGTRLVVTTRHRI